MKILHLFSNFKFTGPADPALVLARAQQELGHDVAVALGRPPRPEMEAKLDDIARSRGLEVVDALRLEKHTRPLSFLGDVTRLSRLLHERAPDVLHCHMPNDHLMAVAAARRHRRPVFRTIYDASLEAGFRARTALRRTAGIFAFSPAVADSVRPLVPETTRVETVDPIIDLERFPHGPSDELRGAWGAAPGDFVVGVIARMQTHRLFPELIAGFEGAAVDDPGLRLVVLGRGTHQETVAKEPARRSGVADRIVFPGYIDPEEYPRRVPCFDALIFLVPGSDGTCRAAREALVCGVPVIASRRGLLPQLVDDAETGLLLDDETPEAIASAIRRLRDDPALTRRLAATAAESARARFDPAEGARRIVEVYGG